MKRLALVATSIPFILSSYCAPSLADPSLTTKESRAVVIVSGGATSSPFTTPTLACKKGGNYGGKFFLAAGNMDTELREYMLNKGKVVYTAPVMDTWGRVQEPNDDRPGPFADCPIVLPETMTIMSTGDINAGGERLARFLGYLNTKYAVTDVDLVGHSNGGLWSRAAIWILKKTHSPIKVRSLITIGTPHSGSVPGRYTVGEITLKACSGDRYKNKKGEPFCMTSLRDWVGFAEVMDKGLNREDTGKFLLGPDGWNAAQGNVLDGIPVTLLAGTYFENPGGDPTVWPYDGTVSRYNAWATDIPDSIIPWRMCWQGKLVHTIYQSESLGIKWDEAITNNPKVLERVNQAIDDADMALSKPNRQGCQ